MTIRPGTIEAGTVISTGTACQTAPTATEMVTASVTGKTGVQMIHAGIRHTRTAVQAST
jgi:hypothetical protein